MAGQPPVALSGFWMSPCFPLLKSLPQQTALPLLSLLSECQPPIHQVNPQLTSLLFSWPHLPYSGPQQSCPFQTFCRRPLFLSLSLFSRWCLFLCKYMHSCVSHLRIAVLLLTPSSSPSCPSKLPFPGLPLLHSSKTGTPNPAHPGHMVDSSELRVLDRVLT